MKVTWTWKGGQVTVNTQQAMAAGIKKCALLLENETKRALNRTGKAVTAKQTKNISGMQHRSYRNVSYSWGGTYTDKNGRQHEGMYWNADRSKWVQASPVGTPPFKQTSLLMNSITHKMANFGLRARVGPRDSLEYARRHELGGKAGYPARPFLKPTYESLIPRFQAILEAAARKGLKP